MQRKAITIASRSEQRSNRTDKNFAIPDNQRVEILVREASASMAEIKRSLAIVIGINQYVNGIPTLKTAVNDAIKIAHTLETKYQYQVLRLLDEDATGGYLKELFTAFEQKTLPLSDGSKTQLHPDDRLLFYFAGHGIALDALDNADGPVGFLVPQDARMDNDSSLLPMKRLHDALLALPCRHLLVILDCCFAGAFRWAGQRDAVRSQKMYRERYERFISGCAQQVITSAADDEKAADSLFRFGQRSEHEGHSPFAELLLKGLSGEADYSRDGAITATELYVYIHGELGKTSAKQTPGFSQLKRHDKGEYIFPIPGFKANKLEEAPKLDEKANPYKGLESFEEGDSEKFFGRKALIETLQDFVANQPLTVVLGASGSGKSSLVKAGLIPQLKKEQEQWRVLDPIRPGESPFRALNHALERENLPVFAIPNQPTDDLTSGDASKEGNSSDNTLWYEQGLQNLSSNLVAWRKLYPNSKLLLIIDQSEELVTLSRDEVEREMFLKGLARALNAFPDWLRIVLTLRSDFEPQFRETALEPYWSGARFIVPAMTREELRQAIVEPATAKVMYFEPPKLVDQLIDEVVQMPGALPLLSFTLSELYLKYIKSVREGKRNNRAITQEDYEQLGGVARSLTQRADYEYEELKKRDSAYERTVRYVMLRMVAVGGGELARRRVLSTELEYPEPENARVKEVIERFVAARLLVKGRDRENQEYVEPAHDVLVRGWQKLLSWKQQEQESLILQRRLTPAAVEWKSQQQAKFLWNADPRLDLLKQVLDSSDNWFNTLEAEFVQQSIRQKQKNIVRRWSIAIGVILGLSGLTIIAVIGQRQAQIDQIRTLRQAAETNLRSNLGFDALLNSLQSVKSLKQPLLQIFKPDNLLQNQVRETLHKALYQAKEFNRLQGHDGSIPSVSFSPDGKFLASGGDDGKVILWDLHGRKLREFHNEHQEWAHRGIVRSISFSPDGQRLATAGDDGKARLWDLQGRQLAEFSGHEGEVYSVSFSPNRKLLATGGKDDTIRLWNLQGRQIKKFPGHQKGVWRVSFSPNGQLLATGGDNGIVRLWNLQGQQIAELPGHRNSIWGISFSPDGQRLATAGYDSTVSVWNLQTHQQIEELRHESHVWSVSFTPDGQQLATGDNQGTIRLWNLQSRQPRTELRGHQGAVWSIAFNRNSQGQATSRVDMVSTGNDGTIRLWNLQDKYVAEFKEHKEKVRSIDFTPDGQYLATGDEKGFVRLWNLHDRRLAAKFGGKCDAINSLSFSRTSQQLASGDEKGSVCLWNLQNRQLVARFKGYFYPITNLSFSPNGQQLAVAGKEDFTTHLRNLQGQLLATFSHEQQGVNGISFSPNGEQLATVGNDRTARLWNLPNSMALTKIPLSYFQPLAGFLHQSFVRSVSLSRDGQLLATGDDAGFLYLRNLRNKKPEDKFKAHPTSALQDLSFSPDGKQLATAGGDGYVRLWNLQLQQLAEFKVDSGGVLKIRFRPNGKQLVTLGKGGTAKLWSVESYDELIARGCSWVWSYLESQPQVETNNKYPCNG